MGEPGWGCAWSPSSELIGWWGERGEVKHLSTRRRRYSVSSGERKRRMAKPCVCVRVGGRCAWGVVGLIRLISAGVGLMLVGGVESSGMADRSA